MKVPVSPLVCARAAEFFPPAEAAIVRAELGDADLPLIANNGERVHLAVLQLAAGDLASLRMHLAIARRDWRDVLVAARM